MMITMTTMTKMITIQTLSYIASHGKERASNIYSIKSGSNINFIIAQLKDKESKLRTKTFTCLAHLAKHHDESANKICSDLKISSEKDGVVMDSIFSNDLNLQKSVFKLLTNLSQKNSELPTQINNFIHPEKIIYFINKSKELARQFTIAVTRVPSWRV